MDVTERTFLVEHYAPGVTADAFRIAAQRVRDAAHEMAAGGAPLRFLHSTFVPEDESSFCVFQSTSGDLVIEAYRRAGVGFERIVHALDMTRESQ